MPDSGTAAKAIQSDLLDHREPKGWLNPISFIEPAAFAHRTSEFVASAKPAIFHQATRHHTKAYFGRHHFPTLLDDTVSAHQLEVY